MVASEHGHQHTDVAAAAGKRPAARLVRDEEALATMTKQQAISEAVQDISAQVRGL